MKATKTSSQQATKIQKEKKTRKIKKTKWFALMGYNKQNEDETGLLGFDLDSKNPYKIVHDT